MTAINAAVTPMYAVPMLHFEMPAHESLNADLSRLFLGMEAEGDRHRDPERRDTQVGIFESHFALHRRSDPCIAFLFGHVSQALFTFIQGINGYSDAEMANIHLDMHSWFHVTRSGGFQSVHNHPNASWSAIYCVDPGDGADPSSGIVRFHDPKTDSMMYRDPANARLQPPYRLGAWQLSHRPGQLVAFPSYLLHEVFPYTGLRPRIIVALNMWAQWRAMPS